MSRRKSRMHAVQILFAIEMNEAPVSDVFKQEIFEVTGDQVFTEMLVEGVLSHQVQIDDYLMRYMEGWELSRIGRVERAILRLGVYEWLIQKKIDRSVVFNEAVELAKAFGDEKTDKFVNGLLAKMKPLEANEKN